MQSPLVFEEKTTLPWAISDWAPYFIINGDHKGEGRVDRLKLLLERHLPDYNFVDIHADTPRLIELWRMKKNACSGATLRTLERENLAYFTAFLYQIPHQFVLVTNRPELFHGRKGQKISLYEVLNNPKLHGVFAEGRSYGKEVDELLKKAQRRNPSVHITSSKDGYVSLYKMLERKRFDYTLEYEAVTRSTNERHFSMNPLSLFQLTDAKSTEVFYFACTKNEWGEKVIKRVDATLQKMAKTHEYQNILETWLNPDLLKKHQKEIERFYFRRSQGPWTTIPN